jgi:hypothetical protein
MIATKLLSSQITHIGITSSRPMETTFLHGTFHKLLVQSTIAYPFSKQYK